MISDMIFSHQTASQMSAGPYAGWRWGVGCVWGGGAEPLAGQVGGGAGPLAGQIISKSCVFFFFFYQKLGFSSHLSPLTWRSSGHHR